MLKNLENNFKERPGFVCLLFCFLRCQGAKALSIGEAVEAGVMVQLSQVLSALPEQPVFKSTCISKVVYELYADWPDSNWPHANGLHMTEPQANGPLWRYLMIVHVQTILANWFLQALSPNLGSQKKVQRNTHMFSTLFAAVRDPAPVSLTQSTRATSGVKRIAGNWQRSRARVAANSLTDFFLGHLSQILHHRKLIPHCQIHP